MAGIGPGRRVVEAADQLPELALASGYVGGHSGDDALQVGGHVGEYLDGERRRRLRDPAEAPGHAAGTGVALGHVVAGEEVHGAVGVGFGAVDHGQQVTSGQGVHLGVRGGHGAPDAIDRAVNFGPDAQRKPTLPEVDSGGHPMRPAGR